MCQFINLSIKTISEKISKIPDTIFGDNHQRKTEISNQQKAYGGFITDDWKKIGTDMKQSMKR